MAIGNGITLKVIYMLGVILLMVKELVFGNVLMNIVI